MLAVSEWLGRNQHSEDAARLVAVVSTHLWQGSQLDRALRVQASARATATVQGDLDAEALAERNLGMTNVRLGRYRRGVVHLERAVQLFDTTGDRNGEMSAVNTLAIVSTMTGDYAQALQQMEQVCAHHRQIGDDESLIGDLTNVGVILSRQGEIARAVELMEEAAELSAEHGWHKREQMARSNVAGLLADTGDAQHADRAERSARRAVELAEYRGDELGLTFAESNLSSALHLGGATSLGRDLASAALVRAERLTAPDLISSLHNNLGEMALREQDRPTALEHFEQAFAVADAAGEAFERDRAGAHLHTLREGSRPSHEVT